jgi:hypothetical protein
MNLISGLPSVLAKISDLLERTIISNVEVRQDTDFPLLMAPFPLRSPPPSFGSPIGDSTFLSASATVANAAAVTVDLGVIGKGIWDIDGILFYIANYSSPASIGYSLFLFDPVGVTQNVLVQVNPFIGSVSLPFRGRVTLDRSDLILRSTLATNGVGNQHNFALSVGMKKLL